MEIFDIQKFVDIEEDIFDIKGKILNVPFMIRGTSPLHVHTSNNKSVKIRFEECTFYYNVFFEIDQNILRTNIEISFNNCFIYGNRKAAKSSVRSNGYNSLELNYYNCIIKNLSLSDLEISRLTVLNSIVTDLSFTVRNCKASFIQFYNVLGNFGIHDCSESAINISYGDENLYLPSSAVKAVLRDIAKRHGSLFAFPTDISISDPKSIFVQFIMSDKGGFIRWDGRFQYHLTEKQEDLLDVSLRIKTHTKTTESIKVNGALLCSLVLASSSYSQIEILRSRIDKVYISDLSLDTLKLYDLAARKKKGSLFESKDVDFSDSTFDKVDLSSYELCSFFRSTLSDISFISPKFPDEIHALESVQRVNDKEENYFRMQSENYRQLKNALISSGNQYEALFMHSKMYNSLKSDPLLDWQNKIILHLNSWSNNHGASIKRPFLLLFGLSGILFFLFRFSIDAAPYQWGWSGLHSWFGAIHDTIVFAFEDWRAYWLLINPTHKLSSLKDVSGELTSTSYFISYISRVIMAWIIYQFIVSFRKFSRKL